ncbi:hypothetical protein HCN44_000062 [Aphidius gifuensis]|uniref:Uncharacterized protein n=1 Tax=Aphidius gifuensis TaxID=684658 RepID=A0A835CNH3_APHGI|nr:serine/threonine-protein kinase RIO3-like [Aphidius gifuensis]XP_044012611.1 serine/threonine-protein kinase RIO3-like [Aphidius gifuensis]KAF7990257.1 hypothetical protein HCN44_000062 [Aphidius gifuensis]
MASPWAKIKPVDDGAVSLQQIAAEEIIKNLQEKEFRKYEKPIEPEIIQDITEIPEELICELEGTNDDAAIAQLLQKQFNQEYDLMLKKTEEKYNGRSKVGISLLNYRQCPSLDPEDEKSSADDDSRDLDRFVSVEKEYASIPRCGYKKTNEGSEIVTKHDMLMSSRINACRVLEFPPGISTGDTAGFDVKLNNQVFNGLRNHSYAHCSREKAKTRPHPKTSP